MDDLNARQREAVRHLDGPLLVLAGAGSGKTRVITAKIARLIRDAGIEPHQVTAVTFTNKAAREMKSRVARLLGGDGGRGPTISTFHTLGLNLLRRELAAAGLPPAQFELAGVCTICEREHFHSWRRDREAAGRFAGLVGLRG